MSLFGRVISSVCHVRRNCCAVASRFKQQCHPPPKRPLPVLAVLDRHRGGFRVYKQSPFPPIPLCSRCLAGIGVGSCCAVNTTEPPAACRCADNVRGQPDRLCTFPFTYKGDDQRPGKPNTLRAARVALRCTAGGRIEFARSFSSHAQARATTRAACALAGPGRRGSSGDAKQNCHSSGRVE